jgi:hypothetical protein
VNVTKLGLTYLNVVSYYAVANLSSSLPHVPLQSSEQTTHDTLHVLRKAGSRSRYVPHRFLEVSFEFELKQFILLKGLFVYSFRRESLQIANSRTTRLTSADCPYHGGSQRHQEWWSREAVDVSRLCGCWSEYNIPSR